MGGAWADAGFRLYDAILGSAVGESTAVELGLADNIGAGRTDDIV
jgi:hypothetical protein